MKLKYVPAQSGVSFGTEEAERIAVALSAIEKSNGLIAPKIVVMEARSPSSPLHKHFTWNDAEAAERFREVEAAKLIRSVYVIDEEAPESIPVRAFVNIVESDDGGEESIITQGYVSITTTLKRTDYQSQVLQYAKEQLRIWRKKFGHYQQFFTVAKAIDETVEDK